LVRLEGRRALNKALVWRGGIQEWGSG